MVLVVVLFRSCTQHLAYLSGDAIICFLLVAAGSPTNYSLPAVLYCTVATVVASWCTSQHPRHSYYEDTTATATSSMITHPRGAPGRSVVEPLRRIPTGAAAAWCTTTHNSTTNLLCSYYPSVVMAMMNKSNQSTIIVNLYRFLEIIAAYSDF